MARDIAHPPPLSLAPRTFDEALRFAELAANSTLVPASYKGKPADVLLAVQLGAELGLSPMQAIQNVSVINGRPSLWGDAMLAVVRASPTCEDVVERIEGEGDAMAAVCIAKRRGASPVEARFSVADAKRAGLWNKQGPWQQYPRRMLQMRARSFALRDAFPDLLRGLVAAEEAADIPPARGPVVTGEAEETPATRPPVIAQAEEGWPVINPLTGAVVTSRPAAWARNVARAAARLEDAGAVRAWAREMEPLIVSVSSCGHDGAAAAEAARAAISARLDELEMGAGNAEEEA